MRPPPRRPRRPAFRRLRGRRAKPRDPRCGRRRRERVPRPPRRRLGSLASRPPGRRPRPGMTAVSVTGRVPCLGAEGVRDGGRRPAAVRPRLPDEQQRARHGDQVLGLVGAQSLSADQVDDGGSRQPRRRDRARPGEAGRQRRADSADGERDRQRQVERAELMRCVQPRAASCPSSSRGMVIASWAAAMAASPARWVNLRPRPAAAAGAAASTWGVRSWSRKSPPRRARRVTACARCCQARQPAQTPRWASSAPSGRPGSSPSIRAEMASRNLSHCMSCKCAGTP